MRRDSEFPHFFVEVWKTQKNGENRWKTVLKVWIITVKSLDMPKFSTILAC